MSSYGRKYYVIKNSTHSIGNRTCVLPACSARPQSTAPPHTGGEKQLFFAKIYLFYVANLPKFCNVTLTVMLARARLCSTQQAACWYRLLTADQVLEVIRPFVLLLRHGYCLLQNIKSIRGLEIFQDAICYFRSFI